MAKKFLGRPRQRHGVAVVLALKWGWPGTRWRQSHHRRWAAAGGILVALACWCIEGHSASTSTPAPSPAPRTTSAPKSVKVVRVAQIPMERTVTALGSLAAYDQTTVSVKTPGRLKSISVDLGSVVKQGQVVAQIETQDYLLQIQQATAALAQARARLGLAANRTGDRIDPERTSTVRQAQAVLDEAQAQHQRALSLFEQGIISKAQVDTSESSYKVALSRYEDALEEVNDRQAVLAQRRSELDLARQQLADATIYAPFDGAVQERHASVGEYLGAGAPLATIVRMNPLLLRGEVPERAAPNVRIGQRVRVTVEGDSHVYMGYIARLSPTISPQTRMLMVEAEVPNNGALRPGAFAHADIVIDAHSKAMAVPAKAITTFAGVDKVLLVQDGKVSEKSVSTGRRVTEWVEVNSGVKVGDMVVLEPGNLQPGQAVTVVE